MDAEDKSAYFRMADKFCVKIRVNPKEHTLLQSMMTREGWTSVSGFVRYKLFGANPDRKIQELIQRKNPNELVILLRNTMMVVAEGYLYYKYRYDKDMRQLYREEGVDLKKWESVTNRWHAEMAKKTEAALGTIRMIAKELGLYDYFDMPSNKMVLPENPTKEELDAMAEQLRIDKTALGYFDEDL